MLRYDQVASYEPYIEESEEETEDGKKETVFGEGGIKITLAGCEDETADVRR